MNTHLTPAQEASNLAARFAALKREGVTQARFARDHNVPGGANMLNQHIKGRRPISMESAVVYARGLGCTLADISPRLAQELDGLSLNKMPVFETKERSTFATALANLFDTIPADPVLRADIFTDLTAAISRAKREALMRKTQEHQEAPTSEKQP